MQKKLPNGLVLERMESSIVPVNIYVRHYAKIIPVSPVIPVDEHRGLPLTPMPKLMRQELGLDAQCACESCRPNRHHVWWERDKYSKGPYKRLRALPVYITEIPNCEHDAIHIAQDEPEIVDEELCRAITRQALLEEQLALARSRIELRRGEKVVPESPKRKVKTLDQLEDEQDRLSEKLGLSIRAAGDLLAPQYYVVEDGGIVIYTCTRELTEDVSIDPS